MDERKTRPGRPRLDSDEKMKMTAVSLRESDAEQLRHVGYGNASFGARVLIELSRRHPSLVEEIIREVR